MFTKSELRHSSSGGPLILGHIFGGSSSRTSGLDKVIRKEWGCILLHDYIAGSIKGLLEENPAPTIGAIMYKIISIWCCQRMPRLPLVGL